MIFWLLLILLLSCQACNFIKKETLVQVFSCEFYGISKNTFSYRTPPVTAFLVLAQNGSIIQRILILQKRAVRIVHFQSRNSHTSPLFKQSSILKFQDEICLENTLFVSKSLNYLSSSVFNTRFSFSSDQHNYET